MSGNSCKENNCDCALCKLFFWSHKVQAISIANTFSSWGSSQPVSIYQDNEQVKLWVAGVVYCRCASVAQSVKCMKISSNKRVSSRVVLQMTKTFTWQTVTLSCLLWKLNIKYEDQIKYATHIGRAEECKLYANIYLKGTSGGFTFAKIEHI